MSADKKIFIGLQIKPDLKNALSHSHLWKDSRIHPSLYDLIEIDYLTKKWLGLYINSPSSTIVLKEKEAEIIKKLAEYVPNFHNKVEIIVFPQLLLN